MIYVQTLDSDVRFCYLECQLIIIVLFFLLILTDVCFSELLHTADSNWRSVYWHIRLHRCNCGGVWLPHEYHYNWGGMCWFYWHGKAWRWQESIAVQWQEGFKGYRPICSFQKTRPGKFILLRHIEYRSAIFRSIKIVMAKLSPILLPFYLLDRFPKRVCLFPGHLNVAGRRFGWAASSSGGVLQEEENNSHC